MSYLNAVLVAEARALGRAQRSTTVRHRLLAKRPFVLMLWQLGAEPFTAAAVAWGFGPKDRTMVVPGEPRDRELAFRALTVVAQAFNAWFEGPRDEAPQVVVPNWGTLTLMGRLGRRLAYLPTTGDAPASPDLVRFGRHLRFLADRTRHPGQQLVVVLTELLASHWQTELSDLETQSLAALDAAIAPPHGKSGHEGARDVEDLEIGPTPGAEDDERVDKLLSAFNTARARSTDERIVAPLRAPIERHYAELADRGWGLVWRCLEREREHPQANHVARRWKDDVEALNRHVDWVVTRGLPYRTRQTNAQAARTLHDWEEAQRMLDAEEAIDDPLRMIPTLLANRAIAGVVRRVDATHKEQGPKKLVGRPLVDLDTAERCALQPGKQLWWTETPGGRMYAIVSVRDAESGGSSVTLRLETGAKGELPREGDVAIFSSHNTCGSPPLMLPAEAPWTHKEAELTPPALDGATDEGTWE